MPITFKSRHTPDIVMLERVGHELLKMMGHSGSVPGALAAGDIPRALAALERAVTAAPERVLESNAEDTDEDGERAEPVSLANRARPLIEMLRTAAAEGDYVIWDH